MSSESRDRQPEDLTADWLDESEVDIAALDREAATSEDPESEDKRMYEFETHFRGTMGMYGEFQAVSDYLDAHEGWFVRCAQPMTFRCP